MRNNSNRVGSKKKDATPPEPLTAKKSNDAIANIFDFVNPTTFVSLPSKGKLYPEEHPLFGKEEIEIKQMTAKQEDILTSKSLLKKGVAIDRFVQSMLVDQSIDVDSLLLGDKGAILVAARVDGYGPDYTTSVTCPSCANTTEYTFDLEEQQEEMLSDSSEVVSSDLPENVSRTQEGTFLISLNAGFDVEVRPLYSSDEKRLIKTMANRQKAKMQDSAVTDQLKTMIVSIAGYSDRPTVNKAVDVMPIRAVREIRETYQKIIPSVDLKRNFSCDACGAETMLEVPLTAEFFWPKQ
jgi:hypothetical protein